MENIKQDIDQLIEMYLQDKGGDITPLQSLRLNNAIQELAICLKPIIDQNIKKLDK